MTRPQLVVTGAFLFTLLFWSLGAPELRSWTGRLAVKGTEPLTVLTLEDAAGQQWRLVGDRIAELRQKGQGRWARVWGLPRGDGGIEVSSWDWMGAP